MFRFRRATCWQQSMRDGCGNYMADQAGFRERSSGPSNSAWYLDPVVAEHKRQAHLDLLRQWMGTGSSGKVLRTDLFEESNGKDQILFDPLFGDCRIS